MLLVRNTGSQGYASLLQRDNPSYALPKEGIRQGISVLSSCVNFSDTPKKERFCIFSHVYILYNFVLFLSMVFFAKIIGFSYNSLWSSRLFHRHFIFDGRKRRNLKQIKKNRKKPPISDKNRVFEAKRRSNRTYSTSQEKT